MKGRTPYYDLRRETIFKLLDQFPDVSTRMIAKIAKRDNPELYRDTEDARMITRRYRGAAGPLPRKTITITKYYKNVKLA